MIAPRNNAEFVADMEKVLSIYKRPYNEKYPVVCFDGMPRLIGESRVLEPMIPEHPEHIDYEYVRNGTCNVLMAVEPLGGWRMAEVTKTKTARDWALFIEKIAEIELNVVSGQCLKRRIGDIETMRHEVAWECERNNKQSGVDWQFTTENARIKLKRLYPEIK